MNIQNALLLVRSKYLEEQKGIITGATTVKYKRACEDYPAMMTVAQHLWARELMKNMP